MDYFALLDEPRRPWLEPETLKQKFLSVSAAVHPDRVHSADEAERRAAQQRYTDLNAAYNCLREPRERLRHLLELESGERPSQLQQVPPNLMDFFVEVGRLCRQVDGFLEEKRKTTSALLQVEVFERGQGWTEKLMALQSRIRAAEEKMIAELKALDAAWVEAAVEARTTQRNRLEELYRLFAYFSRWSGQLRERIVQISF